jgi:hypothetical protein
MLTVAAVGLLAPAACALTRAQANRIALTQLDPARLHRPVVLFGLPRALSARSDVLQAGPGPATGSDTTWTREGYDLVAVTTTPRRRLAHKTWLFWEDLVPYGQFEHPSVLLLIDDKTGKVVRREDESFFPLVNGAPPAFLTPAGYSSTRYRVFANEPVAVRGSHHAKKASLAHPALQRPNGLRTALGPAPSAGLSSDPFAWPPGPAAPAAPVASAAVSGPPELQGSCMVTIGDRTEPLFAGDFKLMGEIASELHLPKYDATDGNDLDAQVTAAIAAGCKDVVIVIAAHGYPATGSNYPSPFPGGGTIPENDHAAVQLKYKTGTDAAGNDVVTTTDLDGVAVREIMTKHPQVGFKLVLQSCFSGRWLELQDQPNVRLIATSSRSDQMSFGWTPSTAPDGAYYAYKKGTQTNATITYTNDTIVDHTTDPAHASPFLTGLFLGLDSWAHSDSERAATGNDLAKALAVAFQHERANNFAEQRGIALPVLDDLSARMPEAPLPPPPALPPAASGWLTDFGSTLQAPATETDHTPVELDLWQVTLAYCNEHPEDPLCVRAGTSGYSLRLPTRSPVARAAEADSGGSASVPATGQVLSIKVKGIVVASTQPGAPPPLTQIHFQDLRPQPDGSVEVIATSQPFNLPSSGSPEQVSTFHPENMCVHEGDYLALSTEGGFEPKYYPEGPLFQVFASSPGSTLDSFTEYNGVNNGAKFTGKALVGEELLMQAELATGAQATALCPGGTKT